MHGFLVEENETKCMLTLLQVMEELPIHIHFIKIGRFKLVLSTLTLIKMDDVYRGIPKPYITVRQYVNTITLFSLVLNFDVDSCQECKQK